MDLLRLQCKGQSYMQQLEHIVTQLKRADQLTQERLDDMLCRTPTGKRRPIMEERKTSRRTLGPLQSTLLSEWETLCAWTKDPHMYLKGNPSRNTYFGYGCCPYPVRDTYTPIRRHIGLLSLLLSNPKFSVEISQLLVHMWFYKKPLGECYSIVQYCLDRSELCI